MNLLSSLPPTSRAVAHSSVVYSHSLTCPSDYQDQEQKRSGVSTPTLEMSDYYLPINGLNTPYHRIPAPFPIVPPSYRPPLAYSGDTGKSQNFRPPSSSSTESNQQIHHKSETFTPGPNIHPTEYAYARLGHPCHSCDSTNSSENEVHPLQEPPPLRIPTLKSAASCQSLEQTSFAPISNPSIKDLTCSSDELYCGETEATFSTKGEYSEEVTKAPCVMASSSTVERCLESKVSSGKKPSNAKVSEKRRQQNRAAQRAMRERRKRAAQNQELHMSTIITENAILREKVTYLSNMLLSHAIAPGSHLPWNPTIPSQENSPPVLPPLSTGVLPSHSATGPPSSSTSPLSFSSQPPLFPLPNLSGRQVFPSTHGPMLSYCSPGSLELDYHQQRNHVAGIRNMSCTSSNSNFSRPNTAEDQSVGKHSPVLGRWNTTSEGISFRSESPIAERIGQFPLTSSIATDSCSINTTSTIPSPTHTDGQLADAIVPNNLWAVPFREFYWVSFCFLEPLIFQAKTPSLRCNASPLSKKKKKKKNSWYTGEFKGTLTSIPVQFLISRSLASFYLCCIISLRLPSDCACYIAIVTLHAVDSHSVWDWIILFFFRDRSVFFSSGLCASFWILRTFKNADLTLNLFRFIFYRC